MTEESIFLEAISIEDAEAREQYLVHACAGDATMLIQVRQLLESHFDSGEFMQRSPAAFEDFDANRQLSLDCGEGLDQASSGSRQVGRYRLIRVLGEGGMGIVWEAEQTDPVRRRVALKIVKPGSHSRNFVARLEAERQAMALMEHTNIATILDAGTSDDGQPYFVMELIQGPSMTDFCNQSDLTLKDKLQLLLDVCQGILHAHQKGIIHRDIKPSNIIVTIQGTKPVPKIIDFGIAKALQGSINDISLETEYGQMIGTLEYMSPEQASLESQDIDTRADIYALGALMYEVVTGTPPFNRKQPKIATYSEMLRAIREVEPTRPSLRMQNGQAGMGPGTVQSPNATNRKSIRVVHELDCIILKCLEKNRTERYSTVSALAEDIRRFLDGEPIEAHPPSRFYRMKKFVQKHQAVVAAAVTMLLLLVAGVVASTTQAVRAIRAEHSLRMETDRVRKERDKAILAERKAESEHELAEIARVNELEQRKLADSLAGIAHRQAYASQVNLAFQAYDEGNNARSIVLLEGLRPRFDEEDLRSLEWYILWNACHQGEIMRWNAERGLVTHLQFLSNGKQLLTSSWNGVHLWQLDNNANKPSLVRKFGNGDMWSFDLTDDESTLATAGTILDPEAVFCWDLADGSRRQDWDAKLAAVRGVAFSKDGQWLSAVGGNGGSLWNVPSGNVTARLTEHSTHTVAFSHDNRRVAVGHVNGSIQVFKINSDSVELEWEAKAHSEVVRSLAFSRDDTLLVSASREIKLWNTSSGSMVNVLQDNHSIVSQLALSSDGNFLASASDDRYVRVYRLKDRQIMEQYAHSQPVSAVSFSRDGTRLASATHAGTVHLWERENRESVSKLTLPDGIMSAVLSADNHRMFVCRTDQCDVVSLMPSEELPLHLELAQPVVAASSHTVVGISNGELQSWNTDGQTLNHRVKLPIRTDRFATSQDVRFFAAWSPRAGSGSVWIGAFDDSMVPKELGPYSSDITLVSSVDMSPKGDQIAIAYEIWWTAIYNVNSGALLHLLTQERESLSHLSLVKFSGDGRKIATGTETGIIRIWDTATGSLLTVLKGHTDAIRSLAFSDDGSTLASGSSDATARLWDITTSQELATLPKQSSAVTSVQFSIDGSALVIATQSGKLSIWRAQKTPIALTRRSELDPDDSGSAAGIAATARQWDMANRTSEARLLFQNASRRFDQLTEKHPSDMDAWEESLRNQRIFASHLFRTDQKEDAVAMIRSSIARQRQLFPDDHVGLGADLCMLGEFLVQQDQYASGLTALEEGIRIRRANEPGTWGTFLSSFWYGMALMGTDQIDQGTLEMKASIAGLLARRRLHSNTDYTIAKLKETATHLIQRQRKSEFLQLLTTIFP